MDLDLDIGVIYTHEVQWIEPLLSTLARSGPGLRMRLLLVDNLAEDIDRYAECFRPTVVLRNAERAGYAANLNRILRCSTARYVLLLNTDMLFEPEARCLEKMVQFMDEHPRCGVSTCRIYHPDGTYAHPARRFQTLQTFLARRVGPRWMFDRHLRHYLYQDHDHQGQFACDWVSGCFMLARREAVEEVGLLDARFIKYYEDVDWCARMNRAGWQVLFNGQTHCYHYEQRSSTRLVSLDAMRHLVSFVRWNWKQRGTRLSGEARRGREPDRDSYRRAG